MLRPNSNSLYYIEGSPEVASQGGREEGQEGGPKGGPKGVSKGVSRVRVPIVGVPKVLIKGGGWRGQDLVVGMRRGCWREERGWVQR